MIRLIARRCLLPLMLVGFTNVLMASGPDTSLDSKLTWHDNYGHAHSLATTGKKMLVVNFVPARESTAQSQLESYIASHAALKGQLSGCVLTRVPPESDLIHHPAFAEMRGLAGLAVIDLQHEGKSYSGRVVSAYPFASGKYYRWRPSYLSTILSLPAGSLTQRTMVWAIRTHGENPASTNGPVSDILLGAARSHSAYQAKIGVQGHHHFGSRSSQLGSRLGTVGSMSEVVAESWPNQTMIDSCIDAVDSWRQSPGHWGEVRRAHGLYGYDIRLGRNGIWYATGIFAQ